MKINNDLFYVGVNDKDIDLFEGQYIVPNGMAYNSYVIIDDKIAVFDTVDERFGNIWLNNLEKVLDEREPDYLIIQHVEPDHSGSIKKFIDKYKNAKLVASSKAFTMIKNFFDIDVTYNSVVVTNGQTLSLGKHVLSFIEAPMVHWPEVIMTYEENKGVLFSADAFGKFGALDVDEDWACEARRYYFGIVGKFGIAVQNLLKKVSALNLNVICPLHGPILTENLSYYVNLYNTWSKYETESEGIVIAYTSVYGNTKKAVLYLKELLENSGVKVVVNDLARCDMAEAVEDAFRYGKIVLATTTYNGDIFPYMREFITHLTERNFQNKTVAFIENGSWMPTATKKMKEMLEKCKNLSYVNSTVSITSGLKSVNFDELKDLANELL